MKRSLFVILVIIAVSISAQAKYSGGAGTAGAPYQIGSAADLLALSANTGDYDAYFVLTADIDLAFYSFATAVIAPDTNNSNYLNFDGPAFTGDFNGNNHTISNLTINTSGAGNNYLGLFGNSGGQIKNLGLENVSITGGVNSVYLGGLVGYNTNATISNCYATGAITGGNDLGGLVGFNLSATISNCYATGVVTGGANSAQLGGLAGASGGTISSCYATGAVTGGSSSSILGGLVGENYGDVSNCYAIGAVTGGSGSSILGGLVGENYNSSSIINCYSTGAVTGGNNSGGLVGENYYGTVSNCYSTGAVSGDRGSSNLGGLAGTNSSGTIDSCYFLAGSGPDNGLGTSLTNTQMKKQSSFSGWDFVNIWQITEGVNYPKLAWQSSGVIKVTKCAVSAGSKGDSISFSGIMSATADDFNDANKSSDANFVKITISDENSEDMDPCVITFPVNNKTWKKGKFSYSGTENGVKKSFTYNVKTGKFTFAANKINLSGLECPLIVDINVGDFASTVSVDEAIVNGTKPIPINLLMGVKNSLRVNNKPKFTKKSGVITQVAISGGFSDKNANDANLLTNPLDITIDLQTFTIPIGKFKNTTKGKFTCSNVNVPEGGIAAATFDFNKCTFTLTIKNTNFTAGPGTVDFNMEFGDFNEGAEISLP